MAQKPLLIMLLVVCITKELQANALDFFFFLDADTVHTGSKMMADVESSRMSVFPFSVPVLQTGDTEVSLV